jgi:dTDP-L-rhamnose 4-epimerase
LADKLLEIGNEVTIYDNLEPQIHGNSKKPPVYLSKDANFVLEDVRNLKALRKILKDVEIVYHLAARVGVSQSMYQIDQYSDTIMAGTARLLDIIANNSTNVEKVVLTSSNTIYGEGKYYCEKCNDYFYPELRKRKQLEQKEWDILCPDCNNETKSVPTDEKTPYKSTSVYALAKEVQEKQLILVGNTYGIDYTIFRLFLVYGSRQTLSNPYTGVCSIFSNALLNNKSPILFEDGNQTRDFVNIRDICEALILGMKNKNSRNEIFNVGTGKVISIKEVAEILSEKINPNIKYKITEKYRIGDIRHCFPDISKITDRLGYSPSLSFKEGIPDFLNWIKSQGRTSDNFDSMTEELTRKGLL